MNFSDHAYADPTVPGARYLDPIRKGERNLVRDCPAQEEARSGKKQYPTHKILRSSDPEIAINDEHAGTRPVDQTGDAGPVLIND